MVPNIIIGHLEQFLFSSYCSKRLYFEIAVKFSFQEHARPPRIQVEKKVFDFRISKSGLVLNGKVLQNHYLTSRKLWGWPQTSPFFAVFRRWNGSKLKLPDPADPPYLGVSKFGCLWDIFMTISNGQNRDTTVSPFCRIKVTVVFTKNTHLRSYDFSVAVASAE